VARQGDRTDPPRHVLSLLRSVGIDTSLVVRNQCVHRCRCCDQANGDGLPCTCLSHLAYTLDDIDWDAVRPPIIHLADGDARRDFATESQAREGDGLTTSVDLIAPRHGPRLIAARCLH